MWFSPWRRILRGRSGDAKPSGLRAGTKFVEEDTGVEYTYDPVMQNWKKRVEPYSAIVCKDGSTVWAEDASGKTIASGESGVDDASVIQSAIDSIGSNRGKIYISSGIYYISNTIEIKVTNGAYPYLSILGAGGIKFGGGTELIPLNDLPNGLLKISGDTSTRIVSIHVSDLAINFKEGTYSGISINLEYVSQVNFTRVAVSGVKGSALQAYSAWDSSFLNCIFYDSRDSTNTKPMIELTGSTAPNDCENVRFINCDFVNNKYVVIGATYAAATKLIACKIHGDTINTYKGVTWDEHSSFTIEGCMFVAVSPAIDEYSGWNVIVGNYFSAGIDNCITLRSDHNTVVGNNMLHGGDDRGIYVIGQYNIIESNNVKGYPRGVDVAGNYNIVGGNILRDGNYGIYETGDYNTFEGNKCIGNTSADYNITGSHTYCDEYLYTSLPTDGFAAVNKPIHYYDGASYYLAVRDGSTWRKVQIS
ncbi:MAG: hypothetical protein DRN64_03610 [Thaumarchaeota archaeon]|nr:MAG: hypothetical protein DRN64_03610 [Nitrososphaerota archaeon]